MLKLSLLVSLIAASGCFGGASSDKWTKDRPPTYSVSGTVLYEGQPLPDASVVFRPRENENAAVGRTNHQGQFSLTTFKAGDGAVVGEHQVSITAMRTEGPPTGANLDEVNPTVKEIWLIPQHYGNFDKSGLSANVSDKTPNQFTFELKK